MGTLTCRNMVQPRRASSSAMSFKGPGSTRGEEVARRARAAAHGQRTAEDPRRAACCPRPSSESPQAAAHLRRRDDHRPRQAEPLADAQLRVACGVAGGGEGGHQTVGRPRTAMPCLAMLSSLEGGGPWAQRCCTGRLTGAGRHVDDQHVQGRPAHAPHKGLQRRHDLPMGVAASGGTRMCAPAGTAPCPSRPRAASCRAAAPAGPDLPPPWPLRSREDLTVNT